MLFSVEKDLWNYESVECCIRKYANLDYIICFECECLLNIFVFWYMFLVGGTVFIIDKNIVEIIYRVFRFMLLRIGF